MELLKILLFQKLKTCYIYHKCTIDMMLYLPHLVVDPGQFFPPGPGAGRLQSRLDCLKQLRLHLPIGRQLPHPPLTTKKIYFAQ